RGDDVAGEHVDQVVGYDVGAGQPGHRAVTMDQGGGSGESSELAHRAIRPDLLQDPGHGVEDDDDGDDHRVGDVAGPGRDGGRHQQQHDHRVPELLRDTRE